MGCTSSTPSVGVWRGRTGAKVGADISDTSISVDGSRRSSQLSLPQFSERKCETTTAPAPTTMPSPVHEAVASSLPGAESASHKQAGSGEPGAALALEPRQRRSRPRPRPIRTDMVSPQRAVVSPMRMVSPQRSGRPRSRASNKSGVSATKTPGSHSTRKRRARVTPRGLPSSKSHASMQSMCTWEDFLHDDVPQSPFQWFAGGSTSRHEDDWTSLHTRARTPSPMFSDDSDGMGGFSLG